MHYLLQASVIAGSCKDILSLNYKYNIEGKMYVWLKIRKDDNKFFSFVVESRRSYNSMEIATHVVFA